MMHLSPPQSPKALMEKTQCWNWHNDNYGRYSINNRKITFIPRNFEVEAHQADMNKLLNV